MTQWLHQYRRWTGWLALLALLSFLPAIVDATPTTEQAKLTASDAAAGDQFGSSVSVAGDTAVVGG